MKRLLLASGILLLIASALAETISSHSAIRYLGQGAGVEGLVSGVHVSRGGTTFIDLDGDYPNEAFTGVIFSNDSSAVGDVSALSGKTVIISGTIQQYRGRPEIVIRSRDQVRVVP